MEGCHISDSFGADLIRWAVVPGYRRGPEPERAGLEFVDEVPDCWATADVWQPPTAVAYLCRWGLLDLAMPVYRPEERESGALIAIAYAGQYMVGDRPLHQAINEVVRPRMVELEESIPWETAVDMLQNSRQLDWTQVGVVAHVIHALCNAIASVAADHASATSQPLPWNPENILRIYAHACKALGQGDGARLLTIDPWTGRLDAPVCCERSQEQYASCRIEEQSVCAAFQDDRSLDWLGMDVAGAEHRRHGQDGAYQSHAFAVRDSRHELRAIVNLSSDVRRRLPRQACEHVMRVAQQVGMFVEWANSLAPWPRRLELSEEVGDVARVVRADTRALCADTAAALSAVSTGGSRTRECVVWLRDGLDYSEAQLDGMESSVLTCYAVADRFPAEDDEQRQIDDIPFSRKQLHGALARPILTPRQLGEEYPQLRESRALAPGFVGLRDGLHHLMLVPIGYSGGALSWRGDSAKALDTVSGLLVVVDSITEALTEEDRRLYARAADQLHTALVQVAERRRLRVEQRVSRLRLDMPGPFSDYGQHEALTDYLQGVADEVNEVLAAEATSIFLSNAFPEPVDARDQQIQLWATSNRRSRAPDGAYTLEDSANGDTVGPDRFQQDVVYDPGQGVTGFTYAQGVPVLRIADLEQHADRWQRGAVRAPEWSARWIELRHPDIGRRGVICAPLQDASGRSFGLLRVSSRRDALRLTQFDEDTALGIASLVASRVGLYAASSNAWGKVRVVEDLSHEIGNRMTPILGLPSRLLRDTRVTRQHTEWLTRIKDSAERLQTTIDSFLRGSRAEAGRMLLDRSEFDLPKFLEDIESSVREEAESKGLALTVMREPGIPHSISTDREKLRTALRNLLSNAVKFTDEGSVTLRVGTQAGDATPCFLWGEVEDTGPGIPDDVKRDLFEPFARAPRETGPGTGLGLALSRQLARLMGGDVSVVRTEIGYGSVFRLEVEIDEVAVDSLDQQEVRQVVGLKLGQETHRALVVDDERDSRDTLVAMLKGAGFETRHAGSGEEAITACKGWPPHIVLMDLRMPGMGGLEATRAIASNECLASTRVLVVTASAREENRQELLGAGAAGFLRKPPQESELLERIGGILGLTCTYEDRIHDPCSATQDSEGEPPRWRVAMLDSELRDQVHEAALGADREQLLDLAGDIAQQDAPLGEWMERRTTSYDYAALRSLFERGGDQ